MLISLPGALLIKKMGVTVSSLLLLVHLDFKNKNALDLERDLRRIRQADFLKSGLRTSALCVQLCWSLKHMGLLKTASWWPSLYFEILPGFPR